MEEFLLTVACTEHMLVIYEMTEGHPILRVRMHYEGASISAKGKYLIAYQGGEINIICRMISYSNKSVRPMYIVWVTGQ